MKTLYRTKHSKRRTATRSAAAVDTVPARAARGVFKRCPRVEGGKEKMLRGLRMHGRSFSAGRSQGGAKVTPPSCLTRSSQRQMSRLEVPATIIHCHRETLWVDCNRKACNQGMKATQRVQLRNKGRVSHSWSFGRWMCFSHQRTLDSQGQER